MVARKPFNPFYPLLVVVGAAFCISACAYGVMAWRAMHPADSGTGVATKPHEMLTWMKANGERLLLVELSALAALTFAAIGTDNYWTRRAKQRGADRNRNAADAAESHASDTHA